MIESEPETRDGRNWLGRMIAFLFLAVGSVLFFLNVDLSNLRDLDPGLFFLAMVLLPVIGAPISLFYIAAGGLYPPGLAIIVGSSALIGSTLIGYGVGRWALGEVTQTKLLRRWPRLASPSEINGVRAIILIRAVPGIPFWAQNIGIGAAKLPFWPYLILSVAIQSVFLVATVLTISGAVEKDYRYLLLGLLILAGAIFLSRFFLKKARLN